MEDKPASFLVMSLGKTLNGTPPPLCGRQVAYPYFCLFFVLFAIFILHSRESELYRYALDGKSALAWELPFFEVYGPPVFHIKVGRPVKCLAQGHNKRTCRLVLHNLP